MVGVGDIVTHLCVEATGAPVRVPVSFEISLGHSEAGELAVREQALREVGRIGVLCLQLSFKLSVQMQVGIIKRLDDAIVVAHAGLRWCTTHSESRLFPPPLAWHQSCNGPASDNIAVRKADQSFIARHQGPKEDPNPPAEVEVGPSALRNKEEYALPEECQSFTGFLPVQEFIRGDSRRIVDLIFVEDDSSILDQPG